MLQKKQDAHELWNNLRSQSQRKLNKREKEIPCNIYNYRNKKTQDDRVVRNIQYSRHRTELMHRVSQMNRNKTKELLKDFYFPSFDDEFNPLPQIEGVEHSEMLEQMSGSKNNIDAALGAHLDKDKQPDYPLKVRFLSEEDCRAAGQFRERMKDLGVVVNSGVSLMDNAYKGSSSSLLIAKEHKESSPSLSTVVVATPLERQAAQRWEPLTMSALEEHGAPFSLED